MHLCICLGGLWLSRLCSVPSLSPPPTHPPLIGGAQIAACTFAPVVKESPAYIKRMAARSATPAHGVCVRSVVSIHVISLSVCAPFHSRHLTTPARSLRERISKRRTQAGARRDRNGSEPFVRLWCMYDPC